MSNHIIVVVASVITLTFAARETNVTVLIDQCSCDGLESRVDVLENTVLQLIGNVPDRATPVPRDTCEHLVFKWCETMETGSDYTTLNATGPGSWPDAGFCRVISRENNLSLDQYVYTVELYNLAHRSGPQHGYPGVAFNVIDADNFDFVYFRTFFTNTDRCLQHGYASSGRLSFTTEARCDAGAIAGVTWFKAKVEAAENSATIYIDDVMVNTVNTNFPARSQTGVIVPNGYLDVMRFRNAEVHAPLEPSVAG